MQNSLTYPPENLVKTLGAAITLMESVMEEVAHLNQWCSISQLPLRRALTLNGLGVLAVHFTNE
jgi:hypothetical protein